MRNAQPVFTAAGRASYDLHQYSPMVRAGSHLHISGIIGHSDGNVPDDPLEEYHAAFTELDARLKAAGGTLADVIVLDSFHVTSALADAVGPFMEVRRHYFLGPTFPAWTAIGVASLGIPGARVEIRALALLPT